MLFTIWWVRCFILCAGRWRARGAAAFSGFSSRCYRLSFNLAGGLLYFIVLVVAAATVVGLVLRIIPDRGPVWTWTPPPSVETGEAAAPPPEPAPPPAWPAFSLQKFLLRGLAILVMAWLCASVASLRPFYAVLLLLWTGVAGFALAQRNEESVSPSPSPPSQDIG